MKKLVLFLLLLLSLQSAEAQTGADSIRYNANRIIDTLSSSYFFGRGYLKNGMQKAAAFVYDRFQTYGLIPLEGEKNYFQHFHFPVNKIEKLNLQLTDKRNRDYPLKVGRDYIPSAGFPTEDGHYRLVFLKKSDLKTERRFNKFKSKIDKNEILVLPQRLENGNERSKRLVTILKQNAVGAAGLIETEKKLTWTVDTKQDSLIRLYFLEGSIFKKAKMLSINGKSSLDSSFPAANVIGMIRGKTQPDSFIVFSAHYDHLGGIGDSVYFPGANDNASGVAMLLTLAHYYSLPQHQPKYSIVLMAFAAEEAGLIGSSYFINHPELNLNKIKFLVNLDMVGYGKEGITVVNATVYPKRFQQLQQINSKDQFLSQVKERGPAANSDHYFFYKAGVPCFFIYTLGGIYYHDIYDTKKVITLYAFPNLFHLLTEFVKTF